MPKFLLSLFLCFFCLTPAVLAEGKEKPIPLSKEAKRILQDPTWRSLSSPSFRLYFKELNEPQAILDHLEEDLRRLEGLLRLEMKKESLPIKVFIFPNQSQWKRFVKTVPTLGKSELYRGFMMRYQREIYTNLFSLPSTPYVLSHELAHVVLRQWLGKENLPGWLDEGFAEWYAHGPGGGFLSLRGRIEKKQHLPLQTLITKKFVMSQRKEAELFYEESHALVEYLMVTYGTERFLRFVTAYCASEKFEEAASEAFGILAQDLKRLEEDWKAYLLKGSQKEDERP